MTGVKNKVHVITTDFTGATLAQAWQKNSALAKDIALLAKRLGESIHFHQHIVPVEGAPAVLLECSDAFFEKVKQLPLFHKACALESGARTIRSTEAPQVESPQSQSRQKPKNKSPGP